MHHSMFWTGNVILPRELYNIIFTAILGYRFVLFTASVYLFDLLLTTPTSFCHGWRNWDSCVTNMIFIAQSTSGDVEYFLKKKKVFKIRFEKRLLYWSNLKKVFVSFCKHINCILAFKERQLFLAKYFYEFVIYAEWLSCFSFRPSWNMRASAIYRLAILPLMRLRLLVMCFMRAILKRTITYCGFHPVTDPTWEGRKMMKIGTSYQN